MLDKFVIHDLFAGILRRKEPFLSFLHIGPVTDCIDDFIHDFPSMNGFFVDSDMARCHKYQKKYGPRHRVYNFTIGTENMFNSSFDENMENYYPDGVEIRTYPFRRAFSFISISNGPYSFLILKQIDLTDCDLLMVEYDMFNEHDRIAICEYCAKFRMTYIPGNNCLIFYKI